jgi:hypothetical protein
LGDKQVNRTEQTRDISSAGVCFLSPIPIEPGSRIEYVITLSDSTPPVHIRCLGKVLRSQRPVPSGGASIDETPDETVDRTIGKYEVAVTMERYQFIRPEESESTQTAAIAAR